MCHGALDIMMLLIMHWNMLGTTVVHKQDLGNRKSTGEDRVSQQGCESANLSQPTGRRASANRKPPRRPTQKPHGRHKCRRPTQPLGGRHRHATFATQTL